MKKPWTKLDLDAIPQLPGMLGSEERQFLYWLGQNSRGDAVVDLGTYLGQSAACLAAGLDAGGGASRIYSYDLFVHGPWCARHDLGEGREPGDDLLPWVKSALAPWDDRIDLVKGDICAQGWSNGVIDVLFVDFTQNWWHHNHVCETFLPHLRVGGVLAHQDYIYVLCYWLHIFMERYADHFDIIDRHILNNTTAWRLVKPLPDSARTGLNAQLSFEQMLALLERSIERYDGIWRVMLEVARVRFFLHAKGPDAASAELSRLRSQYPHLPSAQPHLDQAEAEIAIWPREGGPYAGFFRDT